MGIDERTFEFLDAIIHKDMKRAYKIALDIEQGEQISLFEGMCFDGNSAHEQRRTRDDHGF